MSAAYSQNLMATSRQSWSISRQKTRKLSKLSAQSITESADGPSPAALCAASPSAAAVGLAKGSSRGEPCASPSPPPPGVAALAAAAEAASTTAFAAATASGLSSSISLRERVLRTFFSCDRTTSRTDSLKVCRRRSLRLRHQHKLVSRSTPCSSTRPGITVSATALVDGASMPLRPTPLLLLLLLPVAAELRIASAEWCTKSASTLRSKVPTRLANRVAPALTHVKPLRCESSADVVVSSKSRAVI
mmetsp:Transcript_115678/g.367820  ORF Transcript_115678/g.367820 Transcript_115678/m.367820 type:complete len:247 (-) Transcript_115678:958-1698(-)